MAKKKKRKIKRPASVSSDMMINQIMAMLNPTASSKSGFTDVFAGMPAFNNVTPTVVRKGDMSEIRRWKQRAEDLFDRFSHQLDNQDIDFDAIIEVDQIFADGLITANLESDNESYRLFVNLDPKTKTPWGCECFESLGMNPCRHTFTFTDWLCAMLEEFEEFEDGNADIVRRIALKKYDTKRPDLTTLGKQNFEATIKHFVQKHLPEIKQLPNFDAAELSPIESGTAERLCWDLIPNAGDSELHLRVQPQKKRGNGWTKGRRVSDSNLFSCLHLASDADRKVLQQLSDRRDLYYRHLNFNILLALQALVGQPNVTINGKEAVVRRFQPELEFFRDAKACGVRPKNSVVEESGFVLGYQNFISEINPDQNIIQVAEMAPEVSLVYQSLRSFPRLPATAADQLLQRLRTYQNAISIHLPDDKRKSVDDTTQPVLLLRSRQDGRLDYGFRCRGSRGNLFVPGAGLTVLNVQEKTETIRLVRNPARELAQVQQIAGKLNLPAEPLENSLDNFEQALDLLDRAQQLESNDQLEVLWEKNSADPVKVLGTITAKALRVKVSQDRDWFQLKGKCEFGSDSLDLSDLLSGLNGAETNGQYVRIGKHGWAKVSQQLRSQLNRLADSVNRDRKQLNFDASSVPALREILAGQVNLDESKAWNACLQRIDRARDLQPVVPAALNAELRQYQTEGFCWLRRLAEWGVGGILADDMGLGKTVQTLGVLLDRAVTGPSLVVAPTSVGFNWKTEAERFSPDLNVHLYRETDRDMFLNELGPNDLVVCSYGLLLRDVQKLSEVQWATMVLDEAQAVKNNRSKTAAAAKKIQADWKLALTGTPMENHLGELWSIFNVVAPGVFGGWENFRTRFATPIERNKDEERRLALRDRIQPFVLRRTKNQVLKDLPPRSEQNITIELSAAERKVYDRVRLSAIGEIDEIAKLPQVQDQRFRLLALLTRLRQLACSPKLVHEEWTERSTKLQHLAETLHELKEEGHRVLIFSQFVQHLTLIREMLEEEKITFEYLDGSTSPKARQERVERFQSGDAMAFLISLKAGGTGLNLTAADYVIHMDPWWNPAVEDQATDRAHRIGQQRPVMCYRFVSQGTIEEEILKLHDSKRDLVAGVLEGSSAAAKLSTTDLINLIR